MQTILETERLRTRKLISGDSKFIIELTNTPNWIRFIGDRNIKTDADARLYIEKIGQNHFSHLGYGYRLVALKHDNVPIGICGLLQRDELKHPDIGFAFLPQYSGKGYAFEIAHATLVYVKEKFNLHPIQAITVADNQPSIRLLEKIGLKFMKTIRFDDDPEELLLYTT